MHLSLSAKPHTHSYIGIIVIESLFTKLTFKLIQDQVANDSQEQYYFKLFMQGVE